MGEHCPSIISFTDAVSHHPSPALLLTSGWQISVQQVMHWYGGSRFHRCWLMNKTVLKRGVANQAMGSINAESLLTNSKSTQALLVVNYSTSTNSISHFLSETQSPWVVAQRGSHPTAVILRTAAVHPTKSGCPAHPPTGEMPVMHLLATPAELELEPAACVWPQWDGGAPQLHAGLARPEQGNVPVTAHTWKDVGLKWVWKS